MKLYIEYLKMLNHYWDWSHPGPTKEEIEDVDEHIKLMYEIKNEKEK